MTDVSQSTIGPTLRAFEARNWVRRIGQHYEATRLGVFVATGWGC
jgi:DNA-binding MarR family transcriptional regulator